MIRRLTLNILFMAVLLMAFSVSAWSQDLKVRSLAVAEGDLSASVNVRNDRNGVPCGLIKVQLVGAGAKFDGNIIGDVSFQNNEYWVYMNQGAYLLNVKHPDFLPLDINLHDHGLKDGVQPKVTYKLVLTKSQVPSKIADGFPLKICASFHQGFDRGNFPENVIGLLSTLPQRRLGHGSDTLEVYRNFKDNQYDQLYTIPHEGLINNVNIGDVLTVFPKDESFEPLSVTITDSIVKSNELKCSLQKKRCSLFGYVIDNYTHRHVKKCKVLLYLGSFTERSGSGILEGLGYEKYYEGGKSIGECLTEEDGYFGWKDCVVDYIYYITVEPPKGYAYVEFNKGVNIKPKDNTKDSLIINIKPSIVKGIVTNGKSAIPNVEIECETLYGNKTMTTGQDGSFEIIGLTSEYIRFKHDDFRVMDVKFDDYYLREEVYNITIKMRKGNGKMPFRGEYKWGKITEVK